VHDVADPYDPKPSPPLDELELSLQRLGEEMARRRVADDAIADAEQIMADRAVKNSELAAKQARLLEILRNRSNAIPPASVPSE
jgi:hypothetical protein